MKIVVGFLACLSLLLISHAQDSPVVAPLTATCSTGTPGTISVNGNGQASATADEATVNLKVAVTNGTASGARDVAAEYASDVVDAIRQISGIYPDNVTTTSISVAPKTVTNSQTGYTTVIGYTFTNSIEVQISNVTSDLLSEVLDASVANGGDNLTISSVAFGLSNSLSYSKTKEARQRAAQDAQMTASIYSDALGATLGNLLVVTDQTYGATPYSQTTTRTLSAASNSLASAAVSTPVAIGSQDVSAQITVIYSICNPVT